MTAHQTAARKVAATALLTEAMGHLEVAARGAYFGGDTETGHAAATAYHHAAEALTKLTGHDPRPTEETA